MTEQPTVDQSSTGHLAKALATIQTQLPKIDKAETAEVQTKGGGSYSYNYAGLAAVSDAILPLLGKNGLSFIAKPAFRDGQFVLAYSLLHESGEREDGTYPLPSSGTPQAIGSAITYGRRYCLCAVTGVAPEDDDDGAAAEAEKAASRGTAQRAPRSQRQTSTGSTPRAKTAKRATSSPPPLPGEDEGPAPITDAQMKMLHASYADLGITERDNKLKYAGNVLGRELDSSTGLTKAEASQVIEALKADHEQAFAGGEAPDA